MRGGLALEKTSRSRCSYGRLFPVQQVHPTVPRVRRARSAIELSRDCSTWNIGRRLQELSCIILGADFGGTAHLEGCWWVCSTSGNGTRSGSTRAMQNAQASRPRPKTHVDVPRGTSRIPKHRAALRRLSTSRAITALCLETHRGCSTWNKGASQKESSNGERGGTTLREQAFNGRDLDAGLKTCRDVPRGTSSRRLAKWLGTGRVCAD